MSTLTPHTAAESNITHTIVTLLCVYYLHGEFSHHPPSLAPGFLTCLPVEANIFELQRGVLGLGLGYWRIIGLDRG